jgi:hypothetical protein
MKFNEILPLMTLGRRVRRASWNPEVWLGKLDNEEMVEANPHDLVAADWEIVPEEPSRLAEKCATLELENKGLRETVAKYKSRWLYLRNGIRGMLTESDWKDPR